MLQMLQRRNDIAATIKRIIEIEGQLEGWLYCQTYRTPQAKANLWISPQDSLTDNHVEADHLPALEAW